MEKEVKDSTPSSWERRHSVSQGEVSEYLADLGLESEATRDINPLVIIAAGWNICNSWAGVAATMALSIASGGSAVIVYGILVIFVLAGSSVATLAEIASVYPTAGGQYHWTSILAPEKWSRGLSYCCGAINVFGWISISAGVCIIPPQLSAAMIVFYHTDYVPQAWHIFLMYQALNLLVLMYNITALKRTSWIYDVGFAISIGSFFVILVTCLARSTDKQTSEFVWQTLENSSGWGSDGVMFLTGLINPNYMYAGIDGAIHLAEEVKNPATAVPYALISTVVIGFVTSFAFVVAMLYSTSDFAAVLSTPTGVPIYEIWYQATRSSAAATIFIALLLLCGLFALTGSLQTASRLTWAFGRDEALVFSKLVGQMSPRFHVPVYALLANSFIVFIIGCVYLGSTTAFNAMIGSGLLLQQLSIAFPATLLLYRRRSSQFLPAGRKFNLGIFGWAANILTVFFAILVLIFYNFPFVLPVTGSNMNYTCAVIGIMGFFSIANWFLYARKNYHGPRVHV